MVVGVLEEDNNLEAVAIPRHLEKKSYAKLSINWEQSITSKLNNSQGINKFFNFFLGKRLMAVAMNVGMELQT